MLPSVIYVSFLSPNTSCCPPHGNLKLFFLMTWIEGCTKWNWSSDLSFTPIYLQHVQRQAIKYIKYILNPAQQALYMD